MFTLPVAFQHRLRSSTKLTRHRELFDYKRIYKLWNQKLKVEEMTWGVGLAGTNFFVPQPTVSDKFVEQTTRSQLGARGRGSDSFFVAAKKLYEDAGMRT